MQCQHCSQERMLQCPGAVQQIEQSTSPCAFFSSFVKGCSFWVSVDHPLPTLSSQQIGQWSQQICKRHLRSPSTTSHVCAILSFLGAYNHNLFFHVSSTVQQLVCSCLYHWLCCTHFLAITSTNYTTPSLRTWKDEQIYCSHDWSGNFIKRWFWSPQKWFTSPIPITIPIVFIIIFIFHHWWRLHFVVCFQSSTNSFPFNLKEIADSHHIL